ncbi:hypothetical protein BB559_003524 [Furculomyces boomerangus]|uniref:SGNH hydrolase-type esterase domain-containing protein n=1 Tax=Furculomyces boomerangus TaxID=61424 RepID=A0A2T9YKT3_9FUNG|nr:hypothetical protein BB559_003524 [Furculomyces boomerangus]
MYASTIIAFTTSISLLACTSLAQTQPNPHLIVFGNSLSDVNNRNVFSEYVSPIPYWHGRFSNGPVWNEYLAYFSNYTLINFAVGGAVSNDTFVNSISGQNITLPSANDQVDLYQSVFGNLITNKTAIQNDIGVIEIGGNDALYSIPGMLTKNITFETFSTGYVYSVINAAQKFINLGYRKIIITDIPDLQLVPSFNIVPTSLAPTIMSYIQQTNALLSSAINILVSKNSVDYVRLFSFYNYFRILANPTVASALNITNVSNPCYVVNTVSNSVVSSCTNSDQYMYIDTFHPETRPHAFFGAVANEFIKNQNFVLTTSSALQIIQNYNLSSISSVSNPLFIANSSTTGMLNINEYNISNAAKNAGFLVKVQNGTDNPNGTAKSSANTLDLQKGGFVLISAALICILSFI